MIYSAQFHIEYNAGIWLFAAKTEAAESVAFAIIDAQRQVGSEKQAQQVAQITREG